MVEKLFFVNLYIFLYMFLTNVWNADIEIVQEVRAGKKNIDQSVHSIPTLSSQGTCRVKKIVEKKRAERFAYLEKIPLISHMLKAPKMCQQCGAKKFQFESRGFCCSNGDVSLKASDVHSRLYELFTSASNESRDFKRYIRTYNSNFAFTSLGVTYDKDFCGMSKGIYTFRIQGQIYHRISQLVPVDRPPSFLQLYFHDTDHELQNRLSFSNDMTLPTVSILREALQVNPYCQFFRSLRDVPLLKDHKIRIRCDSGMDQRVYNAPLASQVAAIWVHDEMSTDYGTHDIIVSGIGGEVHTINYYFGCYDPLQYPLLFPYGDTGWHQGIKKVDKQSGQACFVNQDFIDARNIGSVEELLANEIEGTLKISKY